MGSGEDAQLGSGFVGSDRRDEPDGPMRILKLPIVNSISGFSSTPVLLLAKSEKAVEFMIPTPSSPRSAPIDEGLTRQMS
jgi:hypothetical protein